ncbi:putative 55.3 kDa protein in thcA 5'region [Gracilariopsis chorda]|uniref:Putative 55.3 kDa protein in thcA 5'region n=1 Tax=Gracilariopsis chorda TaxID=448386 RepID=A0A2V3IG68_9FLOR|nr:putative 55.3 kDa protein in thcA 5'region [Gracilariopsis chorda]|eukprot:PXF41061.1 putative 55.3 kDa protein in thcA 5'region [Gracilariopsis chorda]
MISHCPGAVRSAPCRLLVPLYWLLGLLTGISFFVGTCFPVKPNHKSRKELKAISSSPVPSVSGLVVVIPAFIRSRSEARVLRSAVEVVLRSKTFVIVVDDYSPFKFSLPSDANTTIIRHKFNLGPAGARNTGIMKALQMGASSIALTDSDCVPTPQWAVKHAQLQQECPGLWAGRTVAKAADVISVYHERTGTLSPFASEKGVFYAPTCNLSISRVVASKLLFDTSFPSPAFEDVTYCCRARELGHEVKLCPKAVVKHAFDNSVTGLMKQFWKYGRGFPLAYTKDPSIGDWLSHSYPVWSARGGDGSLD